VKLITENEGLVLEKENMKRPVFPSAPFESPKIPAPTHKRR
jgi:hypothetical protein